MWSGPPFRNISGGVDIVQFQPTGMVSPPSSGFQGASPCSTPKLQGLKSQREFAERAPSSVHWPHTFTCEGRAHRRPVASVSSRTWARNQSGGPELRTCWDFLLSLSATAAHFQLSPWSRSFPRSDVPLIRSVRVEGFLSPSKVMLLTLREDLSQPRPDHGSGAPDILNIGTMTSMKGLLKDPRALQRLLMDFHPRGQEWQHGKQCYPSPFPLITAVRPGADRVLLARQAHNRLCTLALSLHHDLHGSHCHHPVVQMRNGGRRTL